MSSDSDDSYEVVDDARFGERCVVAPPYVRIVERMLRGRGVAPVYSTRGVATVRLTTDRTASIVVALTPSPALAARSLVADERLVLVDAVVHTQHAAALPIDVVVRLAASPARELVVERRLELSTRTDRLLTTALAYEHARPRKCAEAIRFCSLDALDFDGAALLREARPLVAEARDTDEPAPDVGRVAVPRSTRHAELVRQVARAHQLETLDPVSRACAESASLDGHCTRGTTMHVYESLAVLRCAVAIVDATLAPAAALTQRAFAEATVRPLDAPTWRHALRHVVDDALPAAATLEFVAWFVVLPATTQ